MRNKGKVYLIGAGCGDAELLTLKAKKYIEKADCIIYDRLIDKKILDLAKTDAELIYLGKDNTEGGELQEVINKTLVEKALAEKSVARIKGGDAFVFGRGGEEIEALLKNSIPFEIVPGISSSIAVPEYAGIPVTHRGISKSFHVFTGHTMKNGEWHDFSAIAKLEGTILFLMGMKNLKLIVDGLLENGKCKNTPVALIEKGATPLQRVTLGTLENIIEIAKEKGVKPPATIVIGEVVKLKEKFEWFEKKEFFRKKLLVTRDRKQNHEFVEKLREKGAVVEELPFIEIEDCFEFDFERLKECKVLLFNSSNGVNYFFQRMKDCRVLTDIKIGAVGEKTKEILLKNKIVPDFVPDEYLGERLIKESLNFSEEGDKIFFVTSDISPTDCERWSMEYKRDFEKIVVYRTKKRFQDLEIVKKYLEKVDYITFFSSSTVEAFYESTNGDVDLLKEKKVVSIGPVTTKTLRKFGYSVDIEAKKYNVDGVISAIGDDLDV